MAYDDLLAQRVRDVLKARADISERKMFGGLAFMLGGNMCCGLVGSDLMLRIGEAGCEAALERPHVRPMDFTGRPMRGMIFIDAAGLKTRSALEAWLAQALSHAQTLPKKASKASVAATRIRRTKR